MLHLIDFREQTDINAENGLFHLSDFMTAQTNEKKKKNIANFYAIAIFFFILLA